MLPQQGQTLWQRQQRNVCGRIERAGAGGCGDYPLVADKDERKASLELSRFISDMIACLDRTG